MLDFGLSRIEDAITPSLPSQHHIPQLIQLDPTHPTNSENSNERSILTAVGQPQCTEKPKVSTTPTANENSLQTGYSKILNNFVSTISSTITIIGNAITSPSQRKPNPNEPNEPKEPNQPNQPNLPNEPNQPNQPNLPNLPHPSHTSSHSTSNSSNSLAYEPLSGGNSSYHKATVSYVIYASPEVLTGKRYMKFKILQVCTDLCDTGTKCRVTCFHLATFYMNWYVKVITFHLIPILQFVQQEPYKGLNADQVKKNVLHGTRPNFPEQKRA